MFVKYRIILQYKYQSQGHSSLPHSASVAFLSRAFSQNYSSSNAKTTQSVTMAGFTYNKFGSQSCSNARSYRQVSNIKQGSRKAVQQSNGVKQGSQKAVQQSNGVKLLIPKSDSAAKSQLPSKVKTVPQQQKATPGARERRMARRQSGKHLENKATWQANKLQKKSIRMKKNAQQKCGSAFTSAVGGAKGMCEKPYQKGDRDFKDVVRDYADVAY